eukprot:CAMPEP_0204825042 /NCGR_PEP_ID=MMETSP1346-20131115/3015_1 /ASSEMBLY_ACC=CAM_ASM_000771 /TAXON_ID=215587 /ORGANISM="Aplanochytrium stocchinoi, Strain GSBS06" /LENGTH=496 /DNA_ID=CAMNT_0051952531 /DNA_START=557 /DNA_END=2047 /DNA_ORIENTATION=+
MTVEQTRFQHGPTNGVSLTGVLLAIKKTCCWFFEKRKQAHVDIGFKMDRRLYGNNSQLNTNHLKNTAWLKSQDTVLCLNRYECWNERTYRLMEGKSRTNRILYAKDIWATKSGFCKTLKDAIRKPGTTEEEVVFWIKKYSFDCLILPKERKRLNKLAVEQPDSKWIIKPQASQAGHAIFLCDSQEVRTLSKSKEYLVQPYLNDPYLIDHRKFDMRIHIIVTSVAPLRAYLYPKGFVRFAALPYNKENAHNKSSFLTNVSVNNKLIPTDKLTWQFHQFLKYLGDKGDEVFSNIVKSIGMMLLTTEKIFTEKYKRMGKNFKCRNCYQVLGVDVILDSNLKPYIIEVNGNPTMDFTADKLNRDANDLHHDVAKLIHNFGDVSEDLIDDIETISETDDVQSEFNWVDDDMLDYLLMSKKEQQNLEPWYKLYPPTLHTEEQEEEWSALIEQLNLPELRRKFHDMLISLEKQRIRNCLNDKKECSLDVKYGCRLNPDSNLCS